MDGYDAVITKLDYRGFSTGPVPAEVKRKVLEAARLSPTGKNSQHWRFILVQAPERLRQLAEDSITGKWATGANFAVIVATDPNLGFHAIDAGRVAEDMQIAAWNFGVVSCVFTGMDRDAIRRDFEIPESLAPTIVVCFGYPAAKVTGRRKARKELTEVAFLDRYGNPIDPAGIT